MMWNWDGGGGYGLIGWVFSTVIMLLILGGLAALAIWAINSFSHREPPIHESDDILRRRLAAGEISQEEYERLWHVLHGK